MNRRRVLGLLALSSLVFEAAGATIHGTVQTFDGTPIVRSGVSMLGSVRAFTDDRGVYELKAIPEGVYDLKIEMSGFHSVLVKSVSVRSDESKTLPPTTLDVSVACEGPYAPQWLELTKDRASSGEVASTVSDSRGKTLAGVEVTVWRGSSGDSTATDARGAFRIADLVPGLYSIQLHLRHYWDLNAKDLRIQAGYVAGYGPFTLGKCPLGWCSPMFRKRHIVRCE